MIKTLFAFIFLIAISLCADSQNGIYDLQCGDVESCMRIDTMGERIAKEATVYKLYKFDGNDTLEVCGIKYVTRNDTLIKIQNDTLFVYNNAIFDSEIVCCDTLRPSNELNAIIEKWKMERRTENTVTRSEYELMQRDLREVERLADVAIGFAFISFALILLVIIFDIMSKKRGAK